MSAISLQCASVCVRWPDSTHYGNSSYAVPKPGAHVVTISSSNTYCRSERPCLVLVLVLLLEPGHNSRIGQRCRVAKRLALGNIAKQAPHDLSRARLRQVR